MLEVQNNNSIGHSHSHKDKSLLLEILYTLPLFLASSPLCLTSLTVVLYEGDTYLVSSENQGVCWGRELLGIPNLEIFS